MPPDPVLPPRPLALVGPTAAGKSAVALELGRRFAPHVELVSVDSMQVYRGMDIGTAKPSAGERSAVPHHLLDIAEPTEDFSVRRFQEAAAGALAAIEARRHRAVLVGGTGLYVQAVVDRLDIPARYPEVRDELEREPDTEALHRRLTALDPLGATRMLPTNRRRIVRALEVTIGSGRPFSSFGPGIDAYPQTPFVLVGLRVPRDELRRRIEQRLRAMVDRGLVDEVRALLARHPQGLSRTARQALGYREVLAHLEDGLALDAAVDLAVARTRAFAARQERWFRRDPRIRWVDAGNPLAAVDAVLGDWQLACRAP